MEHAQLTSILTIIIFFGVAPVKAYCPTRQVGRQCIAKCCPTGQYPWRRECKPHPKLVDFSELFIYDKNYQNTTKSVQEVFTIIAGKFVDEPSFKEEAVNRNGAGFNTYILENGDLQLEKPNVYHRWVMVPNWNFCVDYTLNTAGNLSPGAKVFAVVTSEGDQGNFHQSAVYYAVARWISCVFLLLLLVVYALLPELRNLGGLILMNYVATLFVAFLLLAVIILDAKYLVRHLCLFLTLFVYYFFLASFCWMTVMSFDIWWTFRGYAKARPIHRRGERFKLFMYCLFAYGVPLLMAIFVYTLTVVKNMKAIPWFITPFERNDCFFKGAPLMLYLYMPMLIMIVFNWFFYLMTAFNMWRLTRGTAILDSPAAGSPTAHRSQRRRFMVYLKLSVVMGLSWLFEILSFAYPNFGGWWIIDTYNMLVGFVIFVIFVCKKKILRKLYKRCSLQITQRFKPGSQNSQSSTCSDSTQETVGLQVCGNPKGQNIYLPTTK